MRELEHFHPLLLSEELTSKPVSVQLAGVDIVVFRTPAGKVSALLDRCAHRGMRLSCGHVERECLVCPYHGWRYDSKGHAKVPSSPKMTPKVQSFEAVEHQGAIWIRSEGPKADTGALPNLLPTGYVPIGSLRERFNVPVEPLLDKFSEVEHVPTTHHFFGYTAESLPLIQIENHAADDEVYTRFVGPTHRPWATRILEAVNGFWDVQSLVIEATNRFSPLYVELTVYQADSKQRPCGPKIKFFYFFVPTTANTTDLVGFVLWSGAGRATQLLLRRAILAMAKREVLADKLMIERLVETGPTLKGFVLTRFDAAVRENRRLLRVIYRGAALPESTPDSFDLRSGSLGLPNLPI